MFGIPILSLFSAAAELAIAVVVLYAIIAHLRGGEFHWRLLGGALLFEFCVVIAYRFMQAAGGDPGGELMTAQMQNLLAAQGLVSLLTFLGLAILFVLAAADVNAGRRSWFQRHVGPAWTFVCLWLVSVLSGEVIFVFHYLV